uniref:V-set and immunoglobulin domain containing 2 n=1 Tax=Neovison vison TaxID=452646 RepID=A0A8C7C426_NEOVI
MPRPTPRQLDSDMARLLGPILCGALLGFVCLGPGLAVEVKVPAEPLSTPAGKTAELICSYSTSVGDNFALEWSFVQAGKPISESHPILYFTNGHLYPTGSKAKRASLLQNPPTGGVATLKLTDVDPSDTGTYLCQVNNPPDFYTNGLGLINLTVLDPSKGRMAGAVIGVLLGVLFLSVAVFCLIKFQKERRKKPKETYGGISAGAAARASPGAPSSARSPVARALPAALSTLYLLPRHVAPETRLDFGSGCVGARIVQRDV